MDYLRQFADFFLHLDKHLGTVIADYGTLTYVILFAIVFAETGLVVTPILPGDSMIFAAATFAAVGSLDIWLLWGLLLFAAISGDAVNYWIGNSIGPKVFRYENHPVFKKEYLERTQGFYAKYGSMTIVIARFIPIVRTFAPFIAGIGGMSYRRFAAYNVAGGFLWVTLFTFGGYFFGNIPAVRDNFTLVMLGIILLSFVPPLWHLLQKRFAKKAAPIDRNARP
jgi:membrane-associated protein